MPAFIINYSRNRCSVPVDGFINIFLPAVFAIHKTNGHQGNPQIAAFLDVISGQKSQAAGVKRQRTMKPVFSAKISDGKGVWITRKIV